MKYDCILVCENNSEKFDIGHCQTKVKAFKCFPLVAIQTARSYKLNCCTSLEAYIKCVCSSYNNIQNS